MTNSSRNINSATLPIRFFLLTIVIFFLVQNVKAATLTPASGTLPSASVGNAYSQSFVGTAQLSSSTLCTMTTTWVNGTNGLNFSVSGTTGTPPSITGTLSGTPTTSPATYNFSVTFRCTNGGGNNPETITNNYTLNIVAITAASSKISGRVLTPNGRGLGRVRLSVLDMNGNLIQTVSSNQMGYYQISELDSGTTYLIVVRNKRYQFNNHLITPSDKLNNFDFVALE